jgi:hypothetical protein
MWRSRLSTKRFITNSRRLRENHTSTHVSTQPGSESDIQHTSPRRPLLSVKQAPDVRFLGSLAKWWIERACLRASSRRFRDSPIDTGHGGQQSITSKLHGNLCR